MEETEDIILSEIGDFDSFLKESYFEELESWMFSFLMIYLKRYSIKDIFRFGHKNETENLSDEYFDQWAKFFPRCVKKDKIIEVASEYLLGLPDSSSVKFKLYEILEQPDWE